MIIAKWHREHFLERAGNRRACAKDLIRKYGGRDDRVDQVAHIHRLEARDLLLEAEYLERAYTSEDERVLLTAYQVLTEGIFALRQTCVGQPEGLTL